MSHAAEWYIAHSDPEKAPIGPFTPDQLKEKRDQGELSNETHVTAPRLEGEWVLLSDLIEALEASQTQAPPPSPTLPEEEATGFIPARPEEIFETKAEDTHYVKDQPDPARSLFDALQASKDKRAARDAAEQHEADEHEVFELKEASRNKLLLIGSGAVFLIALLWAGIYQLSQSDTVREPIEAAKKEIRKKPKQTETLQKRTSQKTERKPTRDYVQQAEKIARERELLELEKLKLQRDKERREMENERRRREAEERKREREALAETRDERDLEPRSEPEKKRSRITRDREIPEEEILYEDEAPIDEEPIYEEEVIEEEF